MPRITIRTADGQLRSTDCEPGITLRQALLRGNISPHNGRARWLNCKGFGSCGTCAVEVRGEQLGELTAMERWRLDFPPHGAARSKRRLRLACQVRVRGDLEVLKHRGLWGEET